MKLCPFSSNAAGSPKTCGPNCALYAFNGCSLKNLANIDSKRAFDTLHKDMEDLKKQLFELTDKVDDLVRK